MRLLRRIGVAALLAASCFCMAPAAANAGDRDRHRADLVPVHLLGGTSGGELLGEFWANVLTVPAAENPLEAGNAALCMRLGRQRKVAAVASVLPEATCRIRAGTPVFIPLSGGECSDAEPAPFFGRDEAEQRACARAAIFTDEFVTAIRLSLDGGPVTDVHERRYQLVSPQFAVFIPESPIFGATPGDATFVAAGYGVTTRRLLEPGRHVIDGEVDLPDGSTLSFAVAFEVMARR